MRKGKGLLRLIAVGMSWSMLLAAPIPVFATSTKVSELEKQKEELEQQKKDADAKKKQEQQNYQTLGIATPSGRWALPFAGILNGPFSSPAINGFLCSLFLIASTFIISDTLQIKSKLSTLCMGCVLISFPTRSKTPCSPHHH